MPESFGPLLQLVQPLERSNQDSLLRDGRIVVPGQTLSIACAGNAPLPLPGEWKTSVRPYRLHEARHAPL